MNEKRSLEERVTSLEADTKARGKMLGWAFVLAYILWLTWSAGWVKITMPVRT